jgi:predicted RNase H-like nuclease (RuvC/YqgF family)
MRKSKASAAGIAEKLRQIDLEISHGATVADAIRGSGVPKATYYRWRRDCGHATSRSRPVHELEAEITRLKHAVSKLAIENMNLKHGLAMKKAPSVFVCQGTD